MPALPWLALLLAVPLLAGCASQQERYCATLEEERGTLARLAESSAEPRSGMVAETVAAFERLRAEAPDDVRDEWDGYVAAWRGLQRALEGAGADETMFGDGKRPEQLSEEDYAAISAAAVKLRSTAVVEAASSIEQHALDVCKVDLDSSGLTG